MGYHRVVATETSASVVAEPRLLRNAGEIAADLIRRAVFDGSLKAGQRLKEADLARQFGLSRTPIREALLVLQAEGLVTGSPNRGSRVRSYTFDEMTDLFGLRAHLESYAARCAATRITDEQLEFLTGSCERYEALLEREDSTGLGEENLRFHYAVAHASGSVKLSGFVRSSIEVPLVFQSFHAFTTAEWTNSAELHRRIVAALQAHDAERAELVMKEHIFRGRDFWLSQRDDGAPERAPRASAAARRG